jgi:hypothetical protein
MYIVLLLLILLVVFAIFLVVFINKILDTNLSIKKDEEDLEM